ncbi:MAG: transglycosylase SLT domain-containing protein [Chloroflexota bacterium]
MKKPPVHPWLILIFFLLPGLGCSLIGNWGWVPTPTATSSPTPSSTPTPTITPSPTPIPTPLPLARIHAGDIALFYGDWEAATQAYQAALNNSTDPDIQAAALFGLGHSAFSAQDYQTALEHLNLLFTQHPHAKNLAEAYFLLAQIHTAQANFSAAAQAYQDYLYLRPGIIEAYVLEWRGDALFAAGDLEAAQLTYNQALQSRLQMPSDPNPDASLNIQLDLANVAAALGDTQRALELYASVYRVTNNDYTKAHIDLLVGNLYLANDQPQDAYQAFIDAVENFPLSYDAYTALVILVDAGVPVSELQRGIVDYYAQQYSPAIAALDRYLTSGNADQPGTALYYKALSLHGLGEYQAALEAWDQIIASYTDDEQYWDNAWEQKAYTLWAFMGDYRQAVDTLLNFVSNWPDHPRATEFLFDAALIAERGDFLMQAANLWNRVADEYPTSEYVYRSLFLAGITSYRREEYETALVAFWRASQIANTSDLAAALFWQGKTLSALGQIAAAKDVWQQTVVTDPTGYYSERARDLLLEKPPFNPPLMYDLSFDLQAERTIAEEWLRQTFSLSPETRLDTLPNDPRLVRGNELWLLGKYAEARLEFESLRISLSNDPVASFQLVGHFNEIGLYRSAILAARGVLDLVGMDDATTLTAPNYFNYIRFGLYYSGIIIPLAHTYSFHPLFLFSVVRQESLFEGFIRSSAGALGLMQIIPSTGQSIADRAGWPPGYTTEDLYRPKVNLTLGTDYLQEQLEFFDGDIYAALAAYNAGPGNAYTWKLIAPSDPDLYLEIIRFRETRNYIRGIYEIFTIYRRIYQRTP